VIENGNIVDMGTHFELIERPGIYQETYQEQFRSALDMVRA
jgi:subfamily B ATP-binding cassette protein MsbA